MRQWEDFMSLERMTDMGGPSRVVEKEPRDIHVVFETPLIAEPISVVAPFDDDDEEEVEFDPEEEPLEEEPEPVEDSDEATFKDQMLGEYDEQILELGCRVEELEAEVRERESAFQKLRDEDHQRQLVMQEMEVEIAHRKEAGIQIGALFHRAVARNVEVAGKLEELEQKVLSERAEKEALRTHLEMEVMDMIHFEEKWEEANDRADDLEDEVRCKRRKMNKMGYALRTAMERLIDGVHHYPAEQGQTRHTISRDMVVHITQKEYKSAVERGMLD